MLVGLYILFSVLVGLMAIGRRGGFLLFFLIAIFMTPLVSLVILIMATPVVVDTSGALVKKRWRA